MSPSAHFSFSFGLVAMITLGSVDQSFSASIATLQDSSKRLEAMATSLETRLSTLIESTVSSLSERMVSVLACVYVYRTYVCGISTPYLTHPCFLFSFPLFLCIFALSDRCRGLIKKWRKAFGSA